MGKNDAASGEKHSDLHHLIENAILHSLQNLEFSV